MFYINYLPPLMSTICAQRSINILEVVRTLEICRILAGWMPLATGTVALRTQGSAIWPRPVGGQKAKLGLDMHPVQNRTNRV